MFESQSPISGAPKKVCTAPEWTLVTSIIQEMEINPTWVAAVPGPTLDITIGKLVASPSLQALHDVASPKVETFHKTENVHVDAYGFPTVFQFIPSAAAPSLLRSSSLEQLLSRSSSAATLPYPENIQEALQMSEVF